MGINPKDYENTVKDKPIILYGRVLQLGLGFGTLTEIILKEPIDELITIENDQDVIDAFEDKDTRHKIIKDDAKEYYDLL